jgi:lipid-A-disaccharide synthase
LLTICPGSRKGEIARHLPDLRDAVAAIAARRACTFLLASPAGTRERFGEPFFDRLCGDGLVRYCEGETWDAMGHSTLTLAASGTVTVEAALLGAPMVTFYKVTPLSWALGKPLVRVPYYSMVNLVAGRKVVPELIQRGMTGPAIAAEALRLLDSPVEMAAMKESLAGVRDALATGHDPFEESADRIFASLRETGKETARETA